MVEPPGFWAPKEMDPVVVDGRISAGKRPDGFRTRAALIATLRDKQLCRPRIPRSAAVGDRDQNFRLVGDGFDLDSCDQVWLFGDKPGEAAANNPITPDTVIYEPQNNPLSYLTVGRPSQLDGRRGRRVRDRRPSRSSARVDVLPHPSGPDDARLGHTRRGRLPSVNRTDTRRSRPPAARTQPGSTGTRNGIFPVYQVEVGRHFPTDGFSDPVFRRPHGGVIDHFPDHMHEGTRVRGRRRQARPASRDRRLQRGGVPDVDCAGRRSSSLDVSSGG